MCLAQMARFGDQDHVHNLVNRPKTQRHARVTVILIEPSIEHRQQTQFDHSFPLICVFLGPYYL